MASLSATRTVRVPGDKSISHRALILGALGSGPSCVTGILESADVMSTAAVLRALGAAIPELSDEFVIRGGGIGNLRQPQQELDCGNSGTTTRLMAGVVAGLLSIEGTFIGDESLSRRPMRRIARPLEAMGAAIRVSANGGLPMVVRGATLHEIEWTSEVASAQVKSAILLAALTAGVRATVVEPEPSRDHTERMLRARGVHVQSEGRRVSIEAASSMRAIDVTVPGDPSSAAFFAALAAVQGEGTIRIENVCVNPTRIGFLEQLRQMGAQVSLDNEREEGGEPLADIAVSGGDLRGIAVPPPVVPSMVDELPLLACVAAYAEGETVITGAAELRVKESDRIAAVVSNLKAIGVDASELPDGMRIHGEAARAPLIGRVATHGDHRLAMAFGILGVVGGNHIVVDDPDCVAVSYPGFWSDLRRMRAV